VVKVTKKTTILQYRSIMHIRFQIPRKRLLNAGTATKNCIEDDYGTCRESQERAVQWASKSLRPFKVTLVTPKFCLCSFFLHHGVYSAVREGIFLS